MGHKNDYSVIVFFPAEKPKKWEFIHRLDTIADHLNKKHSDWLYMNVYDRRTTTFKKRFYKGNLVPDFL